MFDNFDMADKSYGANCILANSKDTYHCIFRMYVEIGKPHPNPTPLPEKLETPRTEKDAAKWVGPFISEFIKSLVSHLSTFSSIVGQRACFFAALSANARCAAPVDALIAKVTVVPPVNDLASSNKGVKSACEKFLDETDSAEFALVCDQAVWRRSTNVIAADSKLKSIHPSPGILFLFVL